MFSFKGFVTLPVLFLFLTNPSLSKSQDIIEGILGCSIVHNTALALNGGNIAMDGPLDILDDGKLFVRYLFNPNEESNSPVFLLRLEGKDFERVEVVMVYEKNIYAVKNAKIIVRDPLNGGERLELSDSKLKFFGRDHVLILNRYSEFNWQGFSTIFTDSVTLQHTLAIDCRHVLNKLPEILHSVSAHHETSK